MERASQLAALVCMLCAPVLAAPVGAEPASSRPGPDAGPGAGPAERGAPSTQPGETNGMKVTVVSVSGPAQKLRATNGRKWEPIRKGDVLDELTIIRTGLRAKVVLRFADRGLVTINRATKVGIGEFSKTGRAFRARVGLKYGTIRARVESGRGPNDFKVTTPVATLSVRGSGGDAVALVDCPTVLTVFKGDWNSNTVGGKSSLKAGQTADQRKTLPGKIAKLSGATNVADVSGALPAHELNHLAYHGTGRGLAGLGGGKLGANGGPGSNGQAPGDAHSCRMFEHELRSANVPAMLRDLAGKYEWKGSLIGLVRENECARQELTDALTNNRPLVLTARRCVAERGLDAVKARALQIIRDQLGDH